MPINKYPKPVAVAQWIRSATLPDLEIPGSSPCRHSAVAKFLSLHLHSAGAWTKSKMSEFLFSDSYLHVTRWKFRELSKFQHSHWKQYTEFDHVHDTWFVRGMKWSMLLRRVPCSVLRGSRILTFTVQRSAKIVVMRDCIWELVELKRGINT